MLLIPHIKVLLIVVIIDIDNLNGGRIAPDYGQAYYPHSHKTVWIVNIINNISQLDIIEKEGLRMVGGNKFLGGYIGGSV